MSLFASIALAASAASGATLPHCSWDKPGVNPFMGDVVAAVDRYKDIPAPVRAKLKARMQKRDYDEMVTIQRDGIKGRATYASEIRDMHFGAGSVCTTVSRSKWTQKSEERGLVYCEDGQCILVPTVCRNVSRIQRLTPQAIAPAAATNVASSARESDDPQGQLDMDPTSAGVLGGGAPNAPNSFAQQAGAGSGFDGGILATPGGVSSGGQLGGGGATGPGGSFSVPPLTPGAAPLDAGPAPAVPEPQTWGMMLAGLLAMAFIARRRRVI